MRLAAPSLHYITPSLIFYPTPVKANMLCRAIFAANYTAVKLVSMMEQVCGAIIGYRQVHGYK